LLAIALFTNYLAVYILVIVFIPVIYGVVLLEERELRERFGQEYERYCVEVPRFFPKRHKA
jgi:protein-S-isoprenylcysteine O-methyltransferase Ste14